MNEKSVISSGGEVIVPASGETPEDISRASVVRESGIILGGDLNVIKPFKFLTPPFLALTISNGASKNQMVRRAQGKSIVHLHNSDLKQIKLFIPKINEQKKISSFFQKLDTLLVLYQRKIGLLQQLKKAMLQRLFPDTDTYPKLRFDGFSDPWEQRRLGDYLSIPTKEPITDINELKLMTLKLNLEGITLSANRETLKLGATKYYKRHEGQLLYGKQNFFHGSIALIPKEAEGYATSGDVPALDISNVNSKYLVDYISRPSYFKAKEALATGTGSKRIHEKTLLNFKIAVPSLEEQNAISDFITNYTNLIALQQHKLDNMNKLKKFMLQQMFI